MCVIKTYSQRNSYLLPMIGRQGGPGGNVYFLNLKKRPFLSYEVLDVWKSKSKYEKKN